MPPRSSCRRPAPSPARSRRADSERCGVMIAEKSVGSARCRGRCLCRHAALNIGQSWPRSTTRQTRPASRQESAKKTKVRRKGRRARPPRSSRRRRRPRPTTRPLHGAAKPQWTQAEIEEAFRRFQAADAGAEGRTAAHQSVHAAGRGGAVGAGDRRRRQQGDAGAVRARRHAGEDGGARRGKGARTDQDHRALPHQGEERHRAVGEADRRARRRGAAARARRWRRCPASAARPPMSCSTSPSASRPSRSTRISSASATAPGLAPGKDPLAVELKLLEVIPDKYMLHAHHWLILHGRYTCLARRPLCEKCVIADLCKWPGKTRRSAVNG